MDGSVIPNLKGIQAPLNFTAPMDEKPAAAALQAANQS